MNLTLEQDGRALVGNTDLEVAVGRVAVICAIGGFGPVTQTMGSFTSERLRTRSTGVPSGPGDLHGGRPSLGMAT